MPELFSQVTAQYDLFALAYIAALAFILSIFHTFNGFAGGLLLAIFIAPIIGVRAIIPVMAIAMTIDPCLSGYHPHPLYVVCTHFPE